mgnify:CR=1 FL=1
MCTGIKIKKAKAFLDTKYTLKYNNKLSKIKYNHLIDCLNILRFYNYYNYLNYGPIILLHDIGRFYEQQSENKIFNHAIYGYNLLKREFTDNSMILLPIKYHEEDLTWKELLFNDNEFLNCSWINKIKIIKGCKLVRDIDIISNIKVLLEQKLINKKVHHINKKLIDRLYNNEIGDKENIYNEYDEISYMLCGLNLLSFKRSFKYIKKYKIIERLKQIQLNMIANDRELCKTTEKMYDFIKLKFKL